MKRYTVIAAVTLAATAFLVAGCGPSTDSSPQPTVTVTETAQPVQPVQPASNPDQDYLNRLRSLGDSTLNNAPDSSLVKIGHQICSELDQGITVTDIATYLVANGGFTNDEYTTIGRIIGASVYVLCPQYTYQVDQLTGGTNA